jgi:DNA-binding NarL/FixJ family response regulator
LPSSRIADSGDAATHEVVDALGVQLRCLIVDDSALFRESSADLLRREGLDVVGVASNSAQAIQLVAELRPDVILVDIELGGEDGLELTRQLSDTSGLHSQVILVSTHSEDDLAHLIESSPALGFVPKTRLSAQAIRDLLEAA